MVMIVDGTRAPKRNPWAWSPGPQKPTEEKPPDAAKVDIVERLRRSVTKGHEPTDEDAIDAANEIEQLRDEVRRRRLHDLLRWDKLEQLLGVR